LYAIKGLPPNLLRIPSGCAFNPRCPMATDLCREQEPPLFEVAEAGTGQPSERSSACFFWKECLRG
ncbi:oligopeptide/dipeptide ABC transporter ATP-binding protein, partial [Streptomyces sp. NPDC006879]|uniref:oligopeptide/dipeptide ABC transporter ATP-binding protein n=1 Tax=Streptomyces sp. NPDC006879 TaxID=3364767 RepID=UPI00367E3AF8